VILFENETQKMTMVDGDGGLHPGDGGSSPALFLLLFVSVFFFLFSVLGL